jgi:chromosome segregation ATPase
MNEVETIDREVRQELKEIEESLLKMENGLVTERESSSVKRKIAHVKSQLKRMDIELRQVTNRDAARNFKPIIRDHNKKLKDLEQQLEWTQAGKAGNTQDPNNKYAGMDISRNEEDAINYGRDLQNRTQEAADNAITTLVETTNIATDTAQKVHEQTEQIKQIDQTLVEVDNELERANRILKRMARRVMTDKYIWCLVALVFIAIVIIIALSISNGKVKTKQYQPDF